MQLVEKHIITKNHNLFSEIDRVCFASKNLYNAGLYAIRQAFFEGNYLDYYTLQKQFQDTNQPDYQALPRKIGQQVLMLLSKNFKSFFQASKTYKKQPDKFLSKPQLPAYKHKIKGRNVVIYTSQTFSKPLLKKGVIGLSGTTIKIKTNQKLTTVQQVRMIPKATCYVIELVYNVEHKGEKTFNNRIASIDLGINNLATVTSNCSFKSLIINGKPLKSINQFYNRKKAKQQSALKGERKTSRKMEKLTHKRNQKVGNYLHNASRFLTNQLVSADISVLVIGKNPLWKQEVNIGKKNNQKFVQIPHAEFINQLTYKCQLEGIKVVIQEESYTSKCSFLDDEPIQKQENYAGKRLKRGLFKSKNGTLINADVNGSANILRKAFPNAFANGIEGVVVRPIRFTPYKIAV